MGSYLDTDSGVDLKPTDALLRSAYRSALELAKESRIVALAFSSISSGNYAGCYSRRAIEIGAREICSFDGYPELQEVHMFAYKPREEEMLVDVVNGLNLKPLPQAVLET